MRTRRPTGTSRNLLRNVGLALRVVPRMRPAVVVTTGAGVAVPFAWVGRLFGARVVYVESLTRIERPSLTYRLIRPIVSRTYVQWPELRLPGALYRGTVFDRRDLRHARDQAYPFDRLLRGLEGVEGGARRAGRSFDLPPGGRDVVRLPRVRAAAGADPAGADRRLARRHRHRDDGRRGGKATGRRPAPAPVRRGRGRSPASDRPSPRGSRAGDARRRSGAARDRAGRDASSARVAARRGRGSWPTCGPTYSR